MSTYNETVARNLAHMATSAADWKAVPILGEHPNPDGGKPLPEFDIPRGYAHAPTLYPAFHQLDGWTSCELCAHPIKIVYWLQCDAKRWLLAVGSECVTHFGTGLTGEQIAKAARVKLAQELLGEAIAWRMRMQEELRTTTRGYCEKRRFVRRLSQIIGSIKLTSSDAVISGWLTRRQKDAESLIAEIAGWYAKGGNQ